MDNPPAPADRKLGALESLRGLGSLVVPLHYISLPPFPFAYLGTITQWQFEWERWFHTTP